MVKAPSLWSRFRIRSIVISFRFGCTTTGIRESPIYLYRMLGFPLLIPIQQGCSDGGMRADDAADSKVSSDDEEASEECVPAAELGYDEGEEEGEE